MCGIVGYVGYRRAGPILLDGLRHLEYRGYDSAGIAVVHDSRLELFREVGKVVDLEAVVPRTLEGHLGIAHTRWATHGGVTHRNAHPHMDTLGRIAVVHNGIIENAPELRAKLERDGVRFSSETDTEVLPHLIRAFYTGDPTDAVRKALQKVQGTYGIAVIFLEHPDLVIAARNGSPLILGLGDNETLVSSDPQALVRHTRRVVYLNDGEIATVDAGKVQTSMLDGARKTMAVENLGDDWDIVEKGPYAHFMLKEIYEQSDSVRRCLQGRVVLQEANARLGGPELSPRDLLGIGSITFLACGTSYHASMVGALAVESIARVPASAQIASEYKHRNPIISRDSLFFAVSQSGETADTLGAIREVQTKGGEVLGIVNVVGSSIARACGRGIYVHSGPEMAVASTKAFTSQVAAMLLFSLYLARTRVLSQAHGREFAEALSRIPDLVAQYLRNPGPIHEACEALRDARYALFLGRGFSFPVALEGALKLKEVAYVPCEAYAAGEMKHGPIAMLEKGTPVIVIVPRDSVRDKTISNIKEVQARGARVITVHTEGDEEVASLGAFSIPVPATHEALSPLLTVIPLQLIAYRMGVALGRDIDRPRNLAKSVTVE